MSDKRIQVDLSKADFEKRIQVLTLKNQGWSFRKIGSYLGKSHQAVARMYGRIKDLTLEELEHQSKLLIDSNPN